MQGHVLSVELRTHAVEIRFNCDEGARVEGGTVGHKGDGAVRFGHPLETREVYARRSTRSPRGPAAQLKALVDGEFGYR